MKFLQCTRNKVKDLFYDLSNLQSNSYAASEIVEDTTSSSLKDLFSLFSRYIDCFISSVQPVKDEHVIES